VTWVRLCDACGDPITDLRPGLEAFGGDYHDDPSCVGVIQSAIADAQTSVKVAKAPQAPAA
jgi:hypothetical protein